jgi:hypothetical protein
MGGDKFRDEFSLSFDGTDEHLLTDFKPDYIHTNATFAMWVKMGDFIGQQTMGSHSSKRWYLGFSGSKGFLGVANANRDDITITPTPVAGQWLHYAVTAIDGTATLYINGVAMADTLSYTQASATNPTDGFTIGSRNNGGTMQNPMNANISEAVQYDKGLSASEIKTLYNGREPYNHKEGICSSNLKAWWRMGDGVLDTQQTQHEYTGIVCDETNATLGSDLLGGEGNFSDPSYWAISASHSIVEDNVGKFLGSGTYGQINRASIFTTGKMYRVDVDCTSNDGTTIQVNQGDPYPMLVPQGQTGRFHCYFMAKQTYITLYAPTGTYSNAAIIDNLVVREVSGNPAALQNYDTANRFEGDTP